MDRQGFLAIFRPTGGAMLATKRLAREPLLAVAAAAPHTLVIGAAAGATFWRVRRELPYNVVRGGHSGPVVGLYACSGGLVRSHCRDSRCHTPTASMRGCVRSAISCRAWHSTRGMAAELGLPCARTPLHACVRGTALHLVPMLPVASAVCRRMERSSCG